MATLYHPGTARGRAQYGWLDARYSFSFAGYHNPARVHFGVLRVFNDDIIAPGRGFATHPHDNMEIITIPLTGALKHTDSMGNAGIIRAGEVQVMSAGTGVEHAEFNPLQDQSANILQIWIFSKSLNIPPRYDQKAFPEEDRMNTWQWLLAPDVPEALSIHQEAWIARTHLQAGHSLPYTPKADGNGQYIFVISGQVEVLGETLSARDGLSITNEQTYTLTALAEDAEVIVLDVPMTLPAYLQAG